MNVTENSTELAGGEVYFGSQFHGGEDMKTEGACVRSLWFAYLYLVR